MNTTFRLEVFPVVALALLIAQPAWAQFELGATGYLDAVEVSTPEISETRGALLGGLQAGYHMAPWSFSGEYVEGNSFGREIERSRAEVAVGYSISDSFDLTAGIRHDDVEVIDSEFLFLFFFVPVTTTHSEAQLNLTQAFVGANYESDRQRKIGVLGSARLYRGSADVSIRSGRSRSDDSEGFRAELGIRLGPPDAPYIVGVAYESFNLSDLGIDLRSKPVVFVGRRITIR